MYMCICVYVCMYVCMYACMHVCMYCMYVCRPISNMGKDYALFTRWRMYLMNNSTKKRAVKKFKVDST